MYPDARRQLVRLLGELTAETDPETVRTPKRGGLLSLFLSPRKHRSEGICAGRARLTRSRVRRSLGIGPRRPNRSKQGTERARAVRRLGVPVGMGGKANCLCLRGIWETPKPRYREETKPVV
jgi:hypothetical protein